MSAPLARLTGIARRFGAVMALAGADLEVAPGEVHGVLGENGAGKTTLLGVLGGLHRPDAGTVEIRGEPVTLRSPREAWAHGVGLVHQHFTLVPALSVLENLALGMSVGGRRWGRLHLEHVRAMAEGMMARTDLRVALAASVRDLGVGDRQRVEILKVLLRDPPILVLDEPTAVLTPGEVGSLFGLLRGLAAEGRAIVLVAHKIDEVLSVADRVTVLRKGRTVLSRERQRVDAATLIEAMVGPEAPAAEGAALGVAQQVGSDVVPDERTPRARIADAASGIERPAGPVARLADVEARRPSGAAALRGVSMTVRRGEIVGVAGVEGNGQRELALILAGRLSPDAGVRESAPGVGFIPQDRTLEGLIPEFDLVQNVALGLQADPRYRRGPWLRWSAVRERAEAIRARFGVRAPDVHSRARALSGGNQQRLVVGRELAKATDLLVAENPTRGLDVSATAFVHLELRRLAAMSDGPGVVLISTDLDEVLALSDRVLVMVRGSLVAVPPTERTRSMIGTLMLGGRGEEGPGG